MTTRAPSAASCRADASPMPEAPPVTIADAPLQVDPRHRQILSMIVALASPPPSHMVCRP